jgi:hypothetical protein
MRKESDWEIERTRVEEAQADDGRMTEKKVNVNPSASENGNLGSSSFEG